VAREAPPVQAAARLRGERAAVREEAER